MLPVNQVLALGMPPIHRAPLRRIRMVLVEHVVLASKIGQSIWVIHPSGRGRQVIAEAIVVAAFGQFFFDGAMRFVQQCSVHGLILTRVRNGWLIGRWQVAPSNQELLPGMICGPGLRVTMTMTAAGNRLPGQPSLRKRSRSQNGRSRIPQPATAAWRSIVGRTGIPPN